MERKPQLYKLLNPDGTTPQQRYQWPAPGEWTVPIKGELVACENAYHVVTLAQVLNWTGPELWTVETEGQVIDSGDKHLARRVRRLERVPGWNDRNLRLFACDCAERALARIANPDPRSVTAIVVARKFANGEATADKLAAAWDASWDAARDAMDAAMDADRDAARDAMDAAMDAARDAARAVWSTAWDAEREWQTKRLGEYLFGKVN